VNTAQDKICTECQLPKPLDAFRNDKYRPDGKSSKCRECKQKRDKELHALNPEPRRQATANWRAANPDKVQVNADKHREEKNRRRRERYAENPERELAINAAWYEENKEERKLTMAAWEDANRAKRKAQKAAQYLANPEPKRAARAAWEAAHPGYGSIKWQRRQSRQAGAEIADLSEEQWLEILERSNYRCCYCPDDCKACRNKTHKFEQEHLTPVVMSGDYTVHNILPSCKSCNAKKGTGAVLKPVQPFLLTVAPPHQSKRTKKGS
jgi:HNH endonuclease